MHIDRFVIKRFRSFEDVTFELNSDLNVFTGTNNSGKTTLLEAVALWSECFHRKIWRAARGSSRSGLRAGDYSFDYEWFIEPATVRSARFGDLFFDLDQGAPIELCARLAGAEGANLELPFTIRYAKGSNYAVGFRAPTGYSIRSLNDFFEQLPHPIRVIHASPVAAIPLREEFETEPKINDLVRHRRSAEVLRNRIYRLWKRDSNRYLEFLDSVSYVLSERRHPVVLELRGDQDELGADDTRDVRLGIRASVGSKEVPKELALLGSGTLQIIEIMLAVDSATRELNLVLLDEPDSHIHRDIQRRLITRLVEHGKANQVFLTTHNEGLIRSTPPRHLFHLTPRMKGTCQPIDRGARDTGARGLQPSPYVKVLAALGSETSLDLLNALEAERLILVEGPADSRHIQLILERERTPGPTFFGMYWAFGGVDVMLARLRSYRDLFLQIRNQKSLWEKAAITLDRDWLTDEQREAVADGLRRVLGAPVHLTLAYTAEATLLTQPDKLLRLLADRARLDGSAEVDEDALAAGLRAALAGLDDRLRQRWQRGEVLAQVFDWQIRRRDQLVALRVDRVFPGDRDLQPAFSRYATRALDEGQRHKLSTKEDVVAVIREATTAAGVALATDDLYCRLIEVATPASWLEDWRALRRVVAP